jgi:hypothetical protein
MQSLQLQLVNFEILQKQLEDKTTELASRSTSITDPETKKHQSPMSHELIDGMDSRLEALCSLLPLNDTFVFCSDEKKSETSAQSDSFEHVDQSLSHDEKAEKYEAFIQQLNIQNKNLKEENESLQSEWPRVGR